MCCFEFERFLALNPLYYLGLNTTLAYFLYKIGCNFVLLESSFVNTFQDIQNFGLIYELLNLLMVNVSRE